MHCPIIIVALSLALLVLIAGLFLLNYGKKENFGIVSKIASYLAITFGVVVFVGGIIVATCCHSCGKNQDCKGKSGACSKEMKQDCKGKSDACPMGNKKSCDGKSESCSKEKMKACHGDVKTCSKEEEAACKAACEKEGKTCSVEKKQACEKKVEVK